MYILVLALPFLSSILQFFFDFYGFKSFKLAILSPLLMGIALIVTLLAFYEVALLKSVVVIEGGNWIEFLNVKWDLIFDQLTVSMLIPIMIISFLVQIYSLSYMEKDPHINRFFSYLSLFSFAMLLLVTGNQFFLMFLGWEAVGVVSYLLVNFWTTGINNNHAALKALFSNKMGDWAFILGIVLVYQLTGTLSGEVLFALAPFINPYVVNLILVCFVIAACAKSAQISLHSWLTAAMAGPTPVSSLLHSSTMVTAGIFLLLRLSPLLEHNLSDFSHLLLIWLGSLTALLGAANGLIETDIKKIIAYSTNSQLGYMIVTIGISQMNLSLFHLINHAFFKSLLFLSAGAFIHALSDQQDIRKMGSLNLLTPITYAVFLLGNLSLMAFPFITGFYSKDFLLELLLVPHSFSHTIAYLFTLFAALFTTLYTMRLLMKAMLSTPQFNLVYLTHLHESSIAHFVLITLSIAAVIIGYLTQDLFLFNDSFSIFIHPQNLRILDGLNYNIIDIVMYIPLFFLSGFFFILPFKMTHSSIGGSNSAIIAPVTPQKATIGSENWIGIANAFNHFIVAIIGYYMRLSIIFYRYIDKGLLEFLGPLGFHRLTHYSAFKLELLATNNLSHQIAISLLGLLSIMGLLQFKGLGSAMALILFFI